MEPEDDGWSNEMRKYIRSVKNRTAKALKRIKRGRIRNNLPFDDAFQKYFLQRTNARIADAYTDFLIDENLEDGQIPSNLDVDQQNCGNGMANFLEMPVVLEQSTTRNASAPFVQNNNARSEQIVISIPSNSLLIPLQMDLNENSEQESRESGENELLNVSDPNKDAGKEEQNTVRGRTLAIESTSINVQNLNFNEHNPDTIDLTTDQEDADSVLVGERNDNATPNVQLQVTCHKRATANTKNDAHTPNQKVIPKTRIEPSSAQQGIEMNLNDGIPSSIDTAQANVAHHSENIMPSNANEEVADGDGLELTVRDDAAYVPNDDDNLQNRMAVLNETLSGNTGAHGGEGSNQRLDMEMAANDLQNMQHSELIDLISDDENVESQAVNGFPKGMQIVANQVQPTDRERKREDDTATSSGSMKKKSKLANNQTVDTKKRHKCDFCEYSTNKKSHLNDHIRTHTNERPYECEVCDKRFTQQQNLNKHMITHRDMFALQCLNCRQGFSTEKEWKSHERLCKARRYECHLCRKIYIREHHLVEHMRAHTGERLRCPKCQKHFSSNRGLSYRIKSHAKLFRFQCLKCNRGFSKRTTWKLHESRCKSKQFECFLCGKKFHHQKGNLLRHMRYKHTGEKPFGCSDCPLRFCSKSNLTSHTKRCHSKNH